MTLTREVQASEIEPMPIEQSLLLFGIPTLLLYLSTRVGIPFIRQQFGLPPEVCWFISAGLLVFAPLLILSFVAYRMEGYELTIDALQKRFRFNSMTRLDWLWAVGSIIFIGIATSLMLAIAKSLLGSFCASPPFLEARSFAEDETWILLAWIPFFFLNIFGEECLWRGYILPRQELTHGKQTWLVHGLLWLMFHLSFGWNLLFILLPIIFTVSFVVQRQKNTWVGILIHGLINGGGFLSIALGLLS